jgi:hypothetical protein
LLILVLLFRRKFFAILKQVEFHFLLFICTVKFSRHRLPIGFLVLGASKSVGFIRFDQRAEAEAAISKLNGTIPKGICQQKSK